MNYKLAQLILKICLIFAILAILPASASPAASDKCENCHRVVSPGLFNQWAVSEHNQNGVSCADCHSAAKEDPDAFIHQGVYIATLVTPRDCGVCHEMEMQQAEGSHHAKAGQILESNDAYLAEVAGGHPAAVAGCESCHGAKMVADSVSTNRLSKLAWPNSGIGRINPDGSLGACSACHIRHRFDKAQARQPETCGKCHLGPDHPQKEIYEESKHGVAYFTNLDRMKLDSESWIAGVDYYAAPTCATCHLSATRAQPVTHDVGDRISWTLRPAISVHTENWEQKRKNMQDVCSACHGPAFYEGHYRQFDGVVSLYNKKFARPAGEIMSILQKNKSLPRPASFSNEIEWVYWELWHHEGRRARQGASMMGPDYTWWHGIYEVAHSFYFKFLPELDNIADPQALGYRDSLLQNDPLHQWLSRPTADLKNDIRTGKMQELFKW